MADYKKIDLQIGTEEQFEEKKLSLPVGTLVGITDPIHESELDTDLQTKINGKLASPTAPTADSAVTMLTDGTVGTKPLSEISGKLYKHYLSIYSTGLPNGYAYITLYSRSQNVITTLPANEYLNATFYGQKGEGSGVVIDHDGSGFFTYKFFAIQDTAESLTWLISDSAVDYDITDTVTEL